MNEESIQPRKQDITITRTARELYILLLRSRCTAIDSQPWSEREHWLWAELIKAGHLEGVTKTNQMGIPTGNVIGGPTVQGRLFLQELEEKEKQESRWGKFKKTGFPILAFLGGIVSAVLIDWLKMKLGLTT